MKNKHRPIAIYLPQFHPIPENDEWWGKGFTEWTNVTKAKPLFKGHYQPQLPADLGFYDLRLEEARLAQEAMAKEYGIYGFCYYHYWFNGKRLLNEPIDRKLKNTNEDFPFMLCWANENWSRRWDGLEQELLMKQEHNFEDDLEHIRFLCKNFFSDERYIRIDDKPFFIFYKPHLFPSIDKTIAIWREEAEKQGFKGLHLGYMKLSQVEDTFKDADFDIAVQFQPDFTNLPRVQFPPLKEKLVHKLRIRKSGYYSNMIVNYQNFVDKQKNINDDGRTLPSIVPMWDNTARKRNGNAFIIRDSTPEKYGAWLKHIKDNFTPVSPEENFIFINAWNEWAEGNHLEPCDKWGKKYLEITKKILEEGT